MANDNTKPGKSMDDAALEVFTDLMIEKIKSIQQDWKKPWFTGSAMLPPRNLSGRYYNGGNALMLSLHTEKQGYKVPVFATFDKIQSLNFFKNKGKWEFCKDAEGNKVPKVSVKTGEKAFPVYLTVFSVVNKESKERIKYDDYKQLTEEERSKYNVYPKLQQYKVFNLDQTNLAEARKDLYDKIIKDNEIKRPEGYQEGGRFEFPAVDTMIKNDLWYCPIKEVYGDDAYYSISKDEIVVPERMQFIDNESFISNLFHEMNHSTGSESRLGRLHPASFGSAAYAREEACSELSAAVVAAHYGLQKHIKSDSAAYLKSWLKSLHEDPTFLKTILADVKKSTNMIIQRVDRIQLDLDRGIEPKREDYKETTLGIGGQKNATPKVSNQPTAALEPEKVKEEQQEHTEVKAEEVANAILHHGRGR